MVRVGHGHARDILPQKIMRDVKRAISRALSFLNLRGKTVILKPEQETAVISLLRGEDGQALLTTGFGKSMIFKVFALSARELNRPVYVFSICPLTIIILR